MWPAWIHRAGPVRQGGHIGPPLHPDLLGTGGGGELLIELPLAIGQPLRDHDADLRQEIPLLAAGLREAAAAQADLATGGGAGGDPHPHGTGRRFDFGFAAQRRLPGRDRDRRVDIRTLDPEPRIRLDLDLQQEIAGRSAAEPRTALAGEADLFAAADPRGGISPEGWP